jgi:hypothetical protein
MTGLECLRAELRKKGFSKGQTESKVVAGVLDIFAESGDKYKQQDELLNEINNLKIEISRLQSYKQRIEYEINYKVGEFKRQQKDAQDYIEQFYTAIEKCETEEGKDMLRLAQMFVNSVDVNSKYDNTAYIIGLAGILSGNKIAPITELKKINKKLFAEEKQEWI